MILIQIAVWIIILPVNVFLYKDVVFLLDKSSSLSRDDYSEAIDFIFNVTKYIPVGASATQFSVVTFSSDVTERFDFDDYTTNVTILQAIKNLKSITPSGSTYTYDALSFVRTSSFISSKGSRSDADKAVIILTDGQSVNLVKTATEAQLLKDSLNTKIFSIGIGSAISSSNAELLNISSDPDSYYSHHANSYLSLCSLIPTVVPKLDPTAVVNADTGCSTENAESAQTSPKDNTVAVASVAAVAGVSGIGLTALAATLLEKKMRDKGGQSKVDDVVHQYDNNTKRGTSRAAFDSSALDDPSARQIPPPD